LWFSTNSKFLLFVVKYVFVVIFDDSLWWCICVWWIHIPQTHHTEHDYVVSEP
jgi:hypothetical protein